MNMIKALWALLQAGNAVSDPAKWKAHQISVNQVAGLIAAFVGVVKVTGHDFSADEQTYLAIAGGVIAGVNWLLTVVTSDKVGVFGPPAVVQPESGAADASKSDLRGDI